MPTARPIIIARDGVEELIVAKEATTSRPAIDTPTPTTAVSSGIPAATSDPRVMTSTTRATARPSASVTDTGTPVVVNIWPPRRTSTSEPSGSAEETRSISAITSSSTCSSGRSSWTCTSACRRSSDTARSRLSAANGSVATTTRSRPSSAFTRSCSAERWSPIRLPSGTR